MFPEIRLVVLEFRPGYPHEALRIHFMKPLTPKQVGVVMGGVAELITENDIVLEPHFPPQMDFVVLQPLSDEEEQIHDADYRAMARHLGFESNGNLPIVAPGQPPFPDEALQGEGQTLVAPVAAWPQ